MRKEDKGRIYSNREMKLLTELLSYSNRYDISIQFWVDQTVVYISKRDVDLNSFGGGTEFAFIKSIEYLKRINKQ